MTSLHHARGTNHTCLLVPTASRAPKYKFASSKGICIQNASTQWHLTGASIQRRRNRQFVVKATSAVSDSRRDGPDAKLIVSVALVLVLGVLNRVFNKLATVPMGNYLFFLAQIQTFGYVLFYGTTLLDFASCGLLMPSEREVPAQLFGKATNEMKTAVDKKRFAFIGGLEAVAQVISMLCVSQLPGVVLPLLNQTILLWQAALGYIFLGQRYTKLQIFGILLVVGGVAKAAWPSGAGGSILGQTNPLFAVLFSFAFLLLAASSLVKDSIFQDGKKKLNGQNIDLFIVNTYGSLAQAVFVAALFPVICPLKNIPLRQLPQYLREGTKAFLGQMPGTEGAPLLPLAYIAINLAMNVAVLNLLRTSGALVTTLSLSALIPLTIVAFTFQWPLIGAAASLSWNFVIGTLLLMSGLVAYNWESLRKNKSE